jgi:Domain of unknown function (DUF4403)
MRRLTTAFSIALTTAVVGCGGREAPPPVVTSDILAAAPAPGPAEVSQFSVPLEYDFSPIMRVVERAVPTRFGSLDSVRMVGGDSRRHYAFVADREPFTAFADGRLVYLKATLAYAAKGYYKPIVGPTIGAGCGQEGDRPRLQLELSTPITLTADWHLQSQTHVENVSPATTSQRDRCDVSILHHDVTARVVDAARHSLVSHLRDIDRRIGNVDLGGRFTEWWNLLARPIRLADGVWLLIGPESLAIGDVTGRNHVLTVPVTLTARPQIVTSAAAPEVPESKPPSLEHGATSGGFRVLIDGTVDYAAASNVVDRAFVDRRITEAGKTLTVRSVRVAPTSKGRVALAVDFSGDANGTLVLLGTPVLDTVSREIVVPDLDYDLATDDQIINSYAWLRSDALRATFRDKAHVPIDSALERGRALLLLGLNRTVGNVLTLSAKVDSVALRGLYVTRDGLVVRAEARGTARVQVRQK